MLSLVYETHSTTLDNERGIATGWLPGELSEEGRQQAVRLGARRREDGLAVVYTSDLARAIETCAIAFGSSGIEVRTDPRLRECNYGALNGMPTATLAPERSRRIDTPFPDGESYRDVVARTIYFLSDLLAERDGQRVLLVCHAAQRYALAHLLNGERLEDAVAAPTVWQPGWEYEIPSGWRG